MKTKDATNILVTVDTGKINGNNVENFVVFTDDNGNSRGKPGNAKDFTSKVEKDKWVYWKGKAMDESSSDSVEIIEVQRKSRDGGAEILSSTSRVQNGTVKGKIKDKDVQGEELYDLTFSINGDPQKTFTIDPKLKML